MFIHLEDQFFNLKNCLYYEYKDSILELEFSGSLSSKVKQTTEEYKDFSLFIEKNVEDLNIMNIDSNIGINLNLVCGIFYKEKQFTIHFVDGFLKNLQLKLKKTFC
jgi:hypothetical protein